MSSYLWLLVYPKAGEHLKVNFLTMYGILLSHFSHVRLCATPQTAAYQAPPTLEFSRQEYWSGLPLSTGELMLLNCGVGKDS